MFDKLIESEPAGGAEFHGRRSYFLVSSVVVGILFITAVVVSIYAADFSLGNTSFELVEMVGPPDLVPTEPENQPVRQAAPTNTSQSQLPTRQVNMLTPDEVPPVAPTTTSVVPNTQQARPRSEFLTGQRFDSNPGGPSGSGRSVEPTSPGSGSLAISKPDAPTERGPDTTPPPPVIKKVPRMISGGALTGSATSLPKPLYPPAAKAVGAQGKVDVQVVIDESGRVISATAVNGNPLLRQAAEDAARKAKFDATTLSGVPVKVTGVIAYSFTR